MSHVDEGALHAYLDGALDEYPPDDAERIREHVDRCASCADRLEVERRARSDAQAMLAMAAPEVEAPSFEELRAYVERTRVRPAASRRLSRLGWAASVVLAVGVGWVLRDGQLQQTTLVDRGFPAAGPGDAPLAEGVATGSAEAENERATSGTEPAAELNEPSADALGDRVVGRVDLPRNRMVERARTETAAAEADLAAPEDVVPVAAPPTAVQAAEEGSGDEKMLDARTMRIRERMPRATEALDPSSDRIADAGSTTSFDRSADPAEAIVPDTDLADVGMPDAPGGDQPEAVEFRTGTVADAGARAEATTNVEARAEFEAGSPSGEGVSVEADASVGADPPAEVDARARGDAGAPVVVASARAVGSGTSLRDTKADGRDVPADSRLAVPGWEVLEVTNLVVGRSYLGGRVLQRQDDGSIIEVINLEPGVGLSVLPPLAEGHREARAEVASGWVLVRGTLDQEALNGLLEQLLPESR